MKFDEAKIRYYYKKMSSVIELTLQHTKRLKA